MVTGSTASSEKPAAAAEATAAHPFDQIDRAGRSADSSHRFFAEIIQTLADTFASPCAVIYVREASQVIQHEARAAQPGQADAAHFRGRLHHLITATLSLPAARARMLAPAQGGTEVALLTSPLSGPNGDAVGAVALVASCPRRSDATAKLTMLECLCRFAGYVRTRSTEASTGPRGATPSADGWTQAAVYQTPEELAFAVTNNLRNKLDCEQVALALADRRQVRILSLSGSDHVPTRSPGVRDLKAAMEECLDAATIIACPPARDWSAGDAVGDPLAQRFRLHEQWRASAAGDQVVSIPLRSQERIAAVLSLRRALDRGQAGWSEEDLTRIRGRVEPYVDALLLLCSARRGLWRHAVDSAKEAASSLTAPGKTGRKVLAATVAITILWVAFGKTDYRLTVPCVVAPATTRVVSAPFDGVLLAAEVLEGAEVAAGAVLCRFDPQELERRRNELVAEINVLEREKDRAMAGQDPVASQLALAGQQYAQARLEIALARLEQCVIRAPISGVVVAGDLRKRQGSLVSLGEVLYTLAPLSGWIVELEVPETDAEDIAAGLSGHFAPLARPDDRHALKILRASPGTQIRGDRRICLAEAQIDLPRGWMRPGVEGVARVTVGRRPVWWVAFHRFIEFVRLNLWL